MNQATKPPRCYHRAQWTDTRIVNGVAVAECNRCGAMRAAYMGLRRWFSREEQAYATDAAWEDRQVDTRGE